MDDLGCYGGVIMSNTLPECTNYPTIPNGIYGPIVGKIPVVLAEPIVQIVVEARIDFKEPVLEIKRIKKNLFIDQCKLIDLGSGKTGKLFLGGFVRKNIEYATADAVCEKSQCINGEIKHLTCNVPFTCVTEIHYITPPQVNYQEAAKTLSLNVDCLGGEGCCGDPIIGRYPCEQNFQHSECFNEKVFCELEEVKFFEDDIHTGSKYIDCYSPSEKLFHGITEKMVVLVRLKLLQKQQVNVPGKPCEEKQKHVK